MPDWGAIRKDFPAVDRYVFLNAAAASPPPRQVRQVVDTYQRELEEAGDLNWDLWLARREHVRVQVAKLIGAEADEIALVDNTSVGLNLIADLLAGEGAVLASELEFPSVTLPFIQRGASVHLLPAVEGVPRLEFFEIQTAPRAATIAVSHVQFANGCRSDLATLAALKGPRRLVVSGTQSVGAFPVDVKAMGVDALACGGHKWLCAGYGAGFVYLSRELVERHTPRIAGWLGVENPYAFENRVVRPLPGSRRCEPGSPPFGAIFALGAAVEYLASIGIDAIAERVLGLNTYLGLGLQAEGFEVLSPGGEHRSGQTLVEVSEPLRASAFLKARGILVTPMAEGIRASTHFYNTENDADALVSALAEYRSGL